MNLSSPNHIILKPITTEKSLKDQATGKYLFQVDLKATKSQISAAFKTIFGISPQTINTNKIKGKIKTDWKKRRPIRKPDIKKAIITVKKDQKIELLSPPKTK
ncbi:MAG: 50S ribosomal protein L23 [Candidatus Shapirobacteria bacterium]|jgi:large subunit ribosomal protein L23